MTEAGRGFAPPRSRRKIAALIILGVVLFAGFMALGTWQVQRLGWKLDLIERVNTRVHAEPVATPGPSQWAAVDADDYEYLHVRVSGQYLADAQTLVQASTRLGRGYWVMTPLRTRRGFIVLINRGFVRALDNGRGAAVPVPPPDGHVSVTGLLRMSDPDGRFLRPNDPAQGRWYSRDVAGIASQVGLSLQRVAPYFIDASAAAEPDKPPVGGLTVVHFRNAHLTYAITWYCLGALVIVAAFLVTRFELRNRRYHAARESR